MKKIIITAVMFAVLLFAASIGVGAELADAVEIQINQSNQTIEAGGSREFSANVWSSSSYSSITWSSNSSYITFDYDYGSSVTVRVSTSAPSGHTATITASVYSSNGTYLAQSSRTITVSAYWGGNVTINPNSISSLPVGDTRTLTAYVDNNNNYNYYVTWTSTSRVSISSNSGYSITVTGLSEGSATVTAHIYATYDGAYIGSNTCLVMVITGGGLITPPEIPEINDMKLMVQPETKAKRIYEVFGAGTSIVDKDGVTLNPNDVVGTG